MLGPGLGGVQQLVGKSAGQLGELHLDFAVALLAFGRQVDTGQPEITQCVVQNGFLRDIEVCGQGAFSQVLVGIEQRPVLAHLGPVFGQHGQAGFIGGPQLGAVAHGVEVADRPPGPPQPGIQFVQRTHQAVPVRRSRTVLQNGGNGRAIFSQDLLDGRHNMFGADAGIGGQVVVLQQGIGLAHGVFL